MEDDEPPVSTNVVYTIPAIEISVYIFEADFTILIDHNQ